MPPIALPLTPDAASLSFDDGDTRIHRSIGSTGVRVLTQRVPAAQSVSASLWVPVGSRDEDPARAGSTHFLEHLLFKGTARRSALDIAVAFDSVGGESNAETGREHTAYWARVRDADLGTAIDVLVDMVTGSVLDPADFDTERGVILDELAMGDDNPVEVVHDAFQLAVHGDTPIGRPVGGTADAIRADLAASGVSFDSNASLLNAARDGIPEVATAIRSAGILLGESLAHIVSFLNPRAVIIGGALSAVDAHVAGVRQALHQSCLPSIMDSLVIESSRTGRAAALCATRQSSD